MDNQQYSAPTPVKNPGKGLSIASIVLGIAGLVISLISFAAALMALVSLALAIVGLVLGVIGKKNAKLVGAPTGMATAGIVCSIVAIAWSGLLILIYVSCYVCVTAAVDSLT